VPTGTVAITGTMPIVGNIVALTETLPVTRSLALLPGLIVDVATPVEIVIAGVITTSVPLTVTDIFSPTLDVDGWRCMGSRPARRRRWRWQAIPGRRTDRLD